MTSTRCTCGFTEAEGAGETITDHLLEVFTPADSRGNDGLPHEEADPALTCLCGLVAATGQELDDHFLAVFTTAGSAGRDGVIHQAAG